MPSQYSAYSRRSIEEAISREIERDELERELAVYMAESDAMRAKVQSRRVLESRDHG